MRFQQDNFKAVHVARFLRTLLRQVRRPIVLLWDGGSIHKGPPIAAVLRDNPRLHLERFPAYAPELNPVEQLWRDFKHHMGNAIPLDKQDIRLNLHGSTRRVRRSQNKLRSFLLAADLPAPL